MIKQCTMCPRECKALRTAKQGYGFCKIPNKIYLAHYDLHHFEEPVISGSNGSGTIFFSGCNLKCEYCQNYKISQDICGKAFSVNQFINIIKELEEKNAHNINLVTPTAYIDKIIEALKLYKPKIPVVYNTSGYEKPKIIKKLLPYIDIFLTDFKYGDNVIAEKYSKAKGYVDYATQSLKVMLTKPNIIENGIMKSGVICRHLILPNNIDNTLKVFEILDKLNVKLISVMAQFTPINQNGELNRIITQREYNRVINALYNYNFDGFVQEKNSYGKEYIPNFCFINK